MTDLNRQHLINRENESTLAARIKSFETAFGMQREMPEALDLSKETDATLKLYGLERGSTKGFAWQCLVARRLAERGVRFIELIDTGSSNNWDAHSNTTKLKEWMGFEIRRLCCKSISDLRIID